VRVGRDVGLEISGAPDVLSVTVARRAVWQRLTKPFHFRAGSLEPEKSSGEVDEPVPILHGGDDHELLNAVRRRLRALQSGQLIGGLTATETDEYDALCVLEAQLLTRVKGSALA
jgi:hypothetical protein